MARLAGATRCARGGGEGLCVHALAVWGPLLGMRVDLLAWGPNSFQISDALCRLVDCVCFVVDSLCSTSQSWWTG